MVMSVIFDVGFPPFFEEENKGGGGTVSFALNFEYCNTGTCDFVNFISDCPQHNGRWLLQSLDLLKLDIHLAVLMLLDKKTFYHFYLTHVPTFFGLYSDLSVSNNCADYLKYPFLFLLGSAHKFIQVFCI